MAKQRRIIELLADGYNTLVISCQINKIYNIVYIIVAKIGILYIE